MPVVFDFILSPNDQNVKQKILRGHIKFGITDPDDVYAANIPLKDTGKHFEAENVEDAFIEVSERIAPIPTLMAFWGWDAEYTYKGEYPVIYHGALFYANPLNLPAKGESPEEYPDKWIPMSGGSGSGFSNRESHKLTSAADTVLMPPRLNKAMFWVVLVNQVPMEPDAEIPWDYSVEGRNIHFHNTYPAGTRITFWYMRSNEYSVDFEDAWMRLRGDPASVYFISAELKLKSIPTVIQFFEALLLIKEPFDVVSFIAVEARIVALDVVRFDTIEMTATSYDVVRFDTIEMGLRS
jgi:hypothetical protein